ARELAAYDTHLLAIRAGREQRKAERAALRAERAAMKAAKRARKTRDQRSPVTNRTEAKQI
ncbi:MAG TPA: hypothetical protein PJ988_05465, partial [Anaerolinea sp.]|nr:hypothetical protein [Anaerolinea sp.]